MAFGTRERRWRGLLVEQIRPAAGQLIVDVGCGTGSLLVLLGRAAPGAVLVGIDPDPEVLRRAAVKAAAAGLAVELLQGFAEDAAALLAGRRAAKVVSSLVFHQVPLAGKAAGLAAMHAALAPGGEIHIADYGLQRTRLMRWLFWHVQLLDGRADTEPNARGILPDLMRGASFRDVAETAIVPTPTGSISLYRGRREGS
ncbi:methyltransferase domain-containing protein [Roseicella aerolata]|uniref:Methyltransferase domain-containing protein n=1 Tax=Roseicella aerolata TaxID=2883479 RepID=A0A9X1IEQ2_9PROT|nr:methyltransferase domain-containing protein [Roseicella aerolata]